MATGFETRQGGRDTFASQGPAVQQLGRGTATGESRGVQRVGGDAVAGGAPNVQITDPGSGAADLGTFMAKAFQPYVERKQQEQFFQGMAHAQAGESIEDLSKSHKTLVGKLFGPTSFEKGAEAFTAVDTVNKWEQGVTENMDKWVRMTPQEQGRALSDHSLSMMTKDPYVNQLVQAELVKRTGPLLDTINKGRFKYQQQQFHDSHFNALSGAADNLQSLAVAASKVNDPSDKTAMAGVETAADNFVSLLHPPEGMEVENFKGTVTDFLTGALQRGNFYAYNAAVSRGALTLIGSDNQAKALSAYDRWSKVGLAEAKGNPQHIADVIAIDEDLRKKKISGLQAAARYEKINAQISQETGIRERAFDTDTLIAAGKQGNEIMAAYMHQQEEREYQAGVRAQERQLDQQDKEADIKLKAANAATAWTAGNVGTFLSQGGDGTAVNVKAQELYNRRDWGTIGRSYDQNSYINKPLQDQIRSKLTAAGGRAFTGDAKEAYSVWQEWSKKDLSSAMGYFGDMAPRLLNMDRMVAAGEPVSSAYLFAFDETDQTKYSPIALNGHEMGEAKADVEAVVNNSDSGWLGRTFGGAQDAMSGTAKNLAINETYRYVGILKRSGSHQPPAELAAAAIKQSMADGHLEIHGGSLAWLNPVNTKPLPQVVRMNPETFRNSLKAVVDDRLKKSGFDAGAGGEFDIHRLGNDLLVWTGTGKIVHITPQDITNAHKDIVAGKLRPNSGRVMPGVGIPL